MILGAFLEKKIPAGERIIQEGDDGDVMFLIESGAFDCIKKIDGHLQCKTCLSAHQSTIYHLPCIQEPLPVIMILRLFNIIHIYSQWGMVPLCFKGGRGTFRCDLSELRFRQSGEEVWPRREKDSKPALTRFLQDVH